ncbi:MAG: hypothetical protein IT258_06465, partial [Saprospiraceae bacterium]|nr:hypothetical protein [Saprospiraceae bacterium]
MREILLSFLACLCFSTFYAQGIYDADHITIIKIQFPTEDCGKKLDSLKSRGLKERLTGSVEIDGKRLDGVGVRYKGNSSY